MENTTYRKARGRIRVTSEEAEAEGYVKMEAMVDPENETIWASQKAIAALFDCTKQNVSYHMEKIFASGELERSTVVKEILTTAQSGPEAYLKTKCFTITWMP